MRDLWQGDADPDHLDLVIIMIKLIRRKHSSTRHFCIQKRGGKQGIGLLVVAGGVLPPKLHLRVLHPLHRFREEPSRFFAAVLTLRVVHAGVSTGNMLLINVEFT